MLVSEFPRRLQKANPTGDETTQHVVSMLVTASLINVCYVVQFHAIYLPQGNHSFPFVTTQIS